MWLGLFSKIFLFTLFFLCLVPYTTIAQTLHQDVQERVAAKVIEVIEEYERPVVGTGASTTVQEVRVQLKSGERVGEVVRFENEMVELAPGDKIFVFHTITIDGSEYFTYADFERRPTLVVVAVLFLVMLLAFSGWQGVRSVLALGGSIAAIFFFLVPALLAGYDPVFSSVGIAGAVLALVLFGTHGVNPRSVIAFGGTFIAVIVTGVIATIASSAMRLSGFSSDASVYLNFATGGQLDLAGLLLGGIIIGILGVLDDVSITQASVVQQLKAANPQLHFIELWRRAVTVGRDHIASLVNTLALVYVGVSLPLILLYTKTESPWLTTLNQEVIAVELLRIMVGSIGLILAVPFTTAVAALYFNNREVEEGKVAHHHHH